MLFGTKVNTGGLDKLKEKNRESMRSSKSSRFKKKTGKRTIEEDENENLTELEILLPSKQLTFDQTRNLSRSILDPTVSLEQKEEIPTTLSERETTKDPILRQHVPNT
ncbi:hypothetical protein AVEN_9271-1 [Araneus ventricosus]|uniref:Uncharacterized protein n=1 Tax=Araneus ventricosus TaxID=182803 RepID=A0A4Y2JTY3_ARAVE|nr:hypothetical protein AVEN_9271-1 [Araneus ventricosus]